MIISITWYNNQREILIKRTRSCFALQTFRNNPKMYEQRGLEIYLFWCLLVFLDVSVENKVYYWAFLMPLYSDFDDFWSLLLSSFVIVISKHRSIFIAKLQLKISLIKVSIKRLLYRTFITIFDVKFMPLTSYSHLTPLFSYIFFFVKTSYFPNTKDLNMIEISLWYWN